MAITNLNTIKPLMEKKLFHCTSIMSEIYEDSYEQGEGKYTGCGATWAVGRNFPNIPTMLAYLKAHHDLSDDLVDYHQDKQKEDDKFERWTLQTTKMVADHSDAQNGGWMEATKDEYDLWRKGELMLYAEHYIIYYHEVR